ncbi:relA-associated inhibitor [Zonotrichia leucophrys gambelii]|uniref:relA-associated inhibitor n=1 Tax=Zonotrichia leucophrys gambelii TaxID=257770 RepID=UPI00314093D4
MASERLRSAQDLLDLTFQSLAMQHMDLKQVELDTAVAKVDELSRQLESLWTDGPGPPHKEQSSPGRSRSSRRSLLGDALELGGGLGDPLGRPQPHFLAAGGGGAELERAPSPRPKVLAVPSPGGGRAPSPRPPPLLRPLELLGGLGGSPGGAFGAERPPNPPPYEVQALYPSLSAPGTFRTQDDLGLKRRPHRSWNESDLDVAYEKKPGGYERTPEPPARPSLGLWRESSLDSGKDGPFASHSATLPRNYKVSPLERRPEPGGPGTAPPPPSLSPLPPFRCPPGARTLPRGWQPGPAAPPGPQPVSRIPVPPNPPGRPPRHKALPLSVIFRLQNAFWEHGGPRGIPLFGGTPSSSSSSSSPSSSSASRGSPQKLPLALPPAPAGMAGGEAAPRPAPPEPPEPEAELERLLRCSDPEAPPEIPPEGPPEGPPEAAPARPLSPTRLQPLLPPEARRVPEFQEVARVLAEMPRPLKRRGSMEQSPGPAAAPARTRHYRQLIPRLLHRPGAAAAAPGDGGGEAPVPVPMSPSPPAPAVEGSAPVAPAVAAGAGAGQVPELRSALRDPSSPRRRPGARVRLNPLVLLLDAALTGELDVVQQAVAELNDPSQPNDEGITALHNAICGANYAIVEFLIASGANVNSPDSHGWTPLHCAASCNDTGVCVALVRHGAAIFATTASDGSLAVEKCDPYREGYADCSSYLTEVEQGMGVLNSGVVYALWDYSAEFGDELSFREGEPVTVLRREPPDELDWWWGSLYGHEGYVPRNYFGLFPRVRPQKKKI